MASIKVFGSLGKTGLTEEKIKSAVEAVFDFLGKDKAVNIAFVASDDMRGHNKRYREIDKPTDVLSFNYGKDGEILLCEEVIAQYRGKDEEISDATLRTIIHGVLHLFGYDHERDKDYDIMKRAEEEIFNIINK